MSRGTTETMATVRGLNVSSRHACGLPCVKCGVPTAQPLTAGVRVCVGCKPKPTLKPCRVCGNNVPAKWSELGITRCRDCTRSAQVARSNREGERSHDDRHLVGKADAPGIAERVEQLRAMYAAAMAHGTETEAKRAGLPTTSEEVPWPKVGPVAVAEVEDDTDE